MLFAIWVAVIAVGSLAIVDFLFLDRFKKSLPPELYAVVAGSAVALVIYGWIANIVGIISAIGDPISLLLILRAIGVFIFPLGSILGFV